MSVFTFLLLEDERLDDLTIDPQSICGTVLKVLFVLADVSLDRF